MKRFFSILVTTVLCIVTMLSLVACKGEKAITAEEQRELVGYHSKVIEYLWSFAKEKSADVAEAVRGVQSDLSSSYELNRSYTYNKNKTNEIIDEGLKKISSNFTPVYNPDAEKIDKYAYPEKTEIGGIKLGGLLKFNDFASAALGDYGFLSIVMGGGRANFSAGEIAYENRTALFSGAMLQKITAIEDETLRWEILKADNVSQIIRSSVISFNHDCRFAMTTHYTPLGVKLINATGGSAEIEQEYCMLGTFKLSYTADEGTNEYPIEVIGNDGGTLDFVFNSASGEVYQKNGIFASIPFVTVDESLNQIGGYGSTGKTEFENGVEKHLNVAYGSKTMQALQPGDEGYDASKPESASTLNDRQKLDIYLPANFDKNRAGGNGVIMCIHGGSWTSGEKESMTAICAYYSRLGYVTAAMNHTYAGRKYNDGTVVGFTEIENEIDLAFKKIKQMSDENGWNITKSATHGYSSGSHLAAWYAYGKGNEANAPIPVVTTFSMVGAMSFYLDCWLDGKLMPLGPQVAVIGLKDKNIFTPDEDKKDELAAQLEKVMSGELPRTALNPMEWTPYDEATYREKLDYISPLSYVKKGDAVPTVLAESLLDSMLISGEHGVQIEKALTEQNIEHDVILFGNSDHMTAGNAECGNIFRKRAEEYLRKYFGY